MSDGLKLKIGFDIEGPGWNIVPPKETSIIQKCYLEIDCGVEKNIEDFLRISKVIQDILTLSMNSATYPTTWIGHTTKSKVEIFDVFQMLAPPYKALQPYEMLFTFGDIRPNATNIIKKWIENYKLLEHVLQLYFARFYHPELYLEIRFLNLAYAFEGYHRALFKKNEYLDEKTYTTKIFHKSLKKDIETNINSIDALTKDDQSAFKNALTNRLKYGYQYSFAKRLMDISKDIPNINTSSEHFGSFIKNEGDRKTFIRKVTDTRNYLVHQDKDAQKNAAQDNELLALTTKLEFLFVIHLLKKIGINTEKINEILSRGFSPLNSQRIN